jgi:hypothetical protein
MAEQHPITRCAFLGGLGLAGIAGGAAAARAWLPSDSGIAHAQDHQPGTPMPMTHNMVEGDIDPATNGFDPTAILTDFDYGKVSTLPGGVKEVPVARPGSRKKMSFLGSYFQQFIKK